MALTKEQKQEIVGQHATHAGDSGSSEIQVALLTANIRQLADHFKTHPHDFHSRRGLLKMVGKRRRLLNYIKQRSEENYRKLIGELGLRK